MTAWWILLNINVNVTKSKAPWLLAMVIIIKFSKLQSSKHTMTPYYVYLVFKWFHSTSWLLSNTITSVSFSDINTSTCLSICSLHSIVKIFQMLDFSRFIWPQYICYTLDKMAAMLLGGSLIYSNLVHLCNSNQHCNHPLYYVCAYF